jgi:thymidine phosphorylase
VGAKIQSRVKALALKKRFEEVGKRLDMKVLVVITDGSEPVGNGIGPVLEARDILWTLQNDERGSKTLYGRAVHLAGLLFEMIGHCEKGEGAKVAKEIMDSGKALVSFEKMLRAQGLVKKNISPHNYKVGKFALDVKSPISGKVIGVDNKTISRIAKLVGAPFDPGAGLYLRVHKNSVVEKDDILYTLYTNQQSLLVRTKEYLKKESGILLVLK